MSQKRGRGRPKVYTGNVVKSLCGMIRKLGASQTMRVARAKAGTALAALRPSGMGQLKAISMPTLLGMAKDAGIVLHRGRPKAKKVVKAKAKTQKAPQAQAEAPAAPATAAA